MKITFILPFDGRRPVGGVKVVYEYANHLVERGHGVTVIHPAGLYLGVGQQDRWYRNISKYVLFALTKKYLPNQWFNLDPRVSVIWVPSLAARFIPAGDVVVATAWETAEWVAKYPRNRGRAFYLIQHFEDWFADRERLIRTWKLPFKKIVISRWLGEIAHSLGESACYIPNGLDVDRFGMDVSPESRDPNQILMLHHRLDWKGTREGLAALAQVQARVPQLRVTLFGVEDPQPGELPGWVRFERLPSKERLRALYNEAAIFVSPSWAEGWALPPAEAMQCGCATVLTDIGGHEYAIHGKTSLLSPPKDIDHMAQNIETLMKDRDQRLRLAHAGVSEMQQYTWSRATSKIETYFKSSI